MSLTCASAFAMLASSSTATEFSKALSAHGVIVSLCFLRCSRTDGVIESLSSEVVVMSIISELAVVLSSVPTISYESLVAGHAAPRGIVVCVLRAQAPAACSALQRGAQIEKTN